MLASSTTCFRHSCADSGSGVQLDPVSRGDIAVWLADQLEPPALMKMVLQFLSDRLASRTK